MSRSSETSEHHCPTCGKEKTPPWREPYCGPSCVPHDERILSMFETCNGEMDLRRELGVRTEPPFPFFWGGAPGLKRGEAILPRLGLPEIDLPTATTVELSHLVTLAKQKAEQWWGGGSVYAVEPVGSPAPGSEYRFRGATVLDTILEGCFRKGVSDLAPLGPPYFHGGRPGLNVGDLILPAGWSASPKSSLGNRERAWMSTSIEEAWNYALQLPGGDLYQVQPEGAARLTESHDPPDGPGIDRVTAEAARIVAVIARGVSQDVPAVSDPRPPNLR